MPVLREDSRLVGLTPTLHEGTTMELSVKSATKLANCQQTAKKTATFILFYKNTTLLRQHSVPSLRTMRMQYSPSAACSRKNDKRSP